MRNFAIAGLVVTLLSAATVVRAQGPPPIPPPEKEHEWLKQFVGEWENEAECAIAPDQPALTIKGTESARMLGGFWMVSEGKADFMGTPFSNVFTLGYDPQKKKYVGTWVDSMTSYMWHYEGTVEADGKTLTLLTEGPSPLAPDKTAKFKEVYEFKSKDHKVFTSSIQDDDGKWSVMMTADSRRK